LAAGVNLPARRVIVKDYQRYDANLGRVEIPVLEYKQMAGRAGRPGYDLYGEALVLARTENEKDFLLDNYVLAEPEEIYSKLAIESALRSHVLSSIANNFANSYFALVDFFSKTLFSVQRDMKELEVISSKKRI
jgi:helicase